jgi:hypothetical protein
VNFRGWFKNLHLFAAMRATSGPEHTKPRKSHDFMMLWGVAEPDWQTKTLHGTHHTGAAFGAYRHPLGTREESNMRLLFGIVLGCALTFGGLYAADHTSRSDRPMVNWDVVAKNVDGLATLARDGWRRIAG